MRRLGLTLGNWHLSIHAGRVSSGNRFVVGFQDWASAVASATGYDGAAILEKAISAARAVRDGQAVFERDTVLFHEPEVDHALLAWLLYAHSRDGFLHVMDFGGALGSLYAQHRSFLDPLSDVVWGVVEQAHVAAAGRQEFATPRLCFFDRTEDCVHALAPNVLLMSSVLQYLPDPYAVLEQELARRCPFVLIHRTMAQRYGPDEIAVQHVPASIYAASYPLWLLDAKRLEACFESCGYAVLDAFDPCPNSLFGPVGRQSPYHSWFLARKG